MEKHPEDFDAEAVRAAERKGRMFWEKMGMDGVRGKVERFSAATWIFTMKNKYGYSDSPNQASDPLEVARQIIEFHEQAKRMESGQ